MTSSILERMAQDSGLLIGQIETVVQTAPLRYKVFYVPKRKGGVRQLAQPAKEVKALQYWLKRELEIHLPIHQAVTAYQIGCSIQKNARLHSHSNFILKLDFTNFFPSITELDFKAHMDRNARDVYTDEDLEVMAQVLFWAPDRTRPLKLCIGAPTSPLISNTILYEFDYFASREAKSREITYTRYADDLTFSSNAPNRLNEMPEIVQDVLKRLVYPRLSLNERKTIHASRSTRRVVTGIVITPQGELSVGRDRKRLVRSMYHRATKGLLSEEEAEKMNGLICFIESVEPGFRTRLQKKFSV